MLGPWLGLELFHMIQESNQNPYLLILYKSELSNNGVHRGRDAKMRRENIFLYRSKGHFCSLFIRKYDLRPKTGYTVL